MAKLPKDVNIVVAVRHVHLPLGSARVKVAADLARFLSDGDGMEIL